MARQLAANHPDDVLQYLREAINRGYKDADGLADPDLEKLRPNSNFQKLVANSKRMPGRVRPNCTFIVRKYSCSESGKPHTVRKCQVGGPRAECFPPIQPALRQSKCSVIVPHATGVRVTVS